MNLSFIASVSASAMHAARAYALGRTFADQRLAEAIWQHAAELVAAIEHSGATVRAAFDHLAPLAATVDSNHQLAALMLAKTVGRDAADRHASIVAGAIGAMETATLATLPKLVDELELRARPLIDQWEARGPGIIRGIARRTEKSLLADAATIVLVHPATGGGGRAYLPYNTVVFEAVLANPLAELPEVARLAWLASQLQLELPVHGERVRQADLPRLAALAMLPAALEAAADVELVRPWPEPLPAALRAWIDHDRAGDLESVVVDRTEPSDERRAASEPAGALSPDKDDEAVAALADTLDRWWQTYLARKPPFSVALEALAAMLEQEPELG